MRGFGFRLKIMLGFATLALLFFGVMKIVDAIRFSHRTEVTFNQFLQQQPKEGWFTIHGGILRAAASVWLKKSESESIREVYVPVRGTVQKDGKPIYLIVKTTDPGILQTANTLNEVRQDHQAARDFGLKHPDKVFVRRDIEGMILAGIDGDSKIKTLLSNQLDRGGNSVDEAFVILEEGKQPSIASGISLVLGGLILGALQALFYISRRGTGRIR